MELLMPAQPPQMGNIRHLDYVEETFLCPQQTDLPVLASQAIEQILLEQQQQQQQYQLQQQQQHPFGHLQQQQQPADQSFLQDMERMSPDSSMDWVKQECPSPSMCAAVPSAPMSMTCGNIPDSTTSDLSYDSDAFNSEDSNDSFVELQRNPSLLEELTRMASEPASPVLVKQERSHSAPTKKRCKRTSDVPFQCPHPECAYSTTSKEHLASHAKVHTEERLFICELCSTAFKWSHTLKRHMQSAHANRSDYRFRCPREGCGKLFSRKDHLTNHEASHDGDRRTAAFACPQCGQAFRSKKNLAGHLKTHTREEIFTCADCGKNFTRKASLRRHVNVEHKGEVITCALCPGRTFRHKSSLDDHVRAEHSGGKREFACDVCGKKFAVQGYRAKHMETCVNKASGKVFPCEVCGRSYRTKRHLNEHCKRLNHGGKSTAFVQQCIVPRYDDNKHEMFVSSPISISSQSAPNAEAELQHYLDHQLHADLFQSSPGGYDHQSGYSSSGSMSLDGQMQQFPVSQCRSVVETVPEVTGNDLPLPQLHLHESEENMGSMLRLVYDCPDPNQAQVHLGYLPQQQQQQQQHQEHHFDVRSPAAVVNTLYHGEYAMLDGLALECL